MWVSKLKVMAPNCAVIGLSHSQKLLGSSSNGVLYTAWLKSWVISHAEKAEGGLEVVKVSYHALFHSSALFRLRDERFAGGCCHDAGFLLVENGT
jgi:hypothetical protein